MVVRSPPAKRAPLAQPNKDFSELSNENVGRSTWVDEVMVSDAQMSATKTSSSEPSGDKTSSRKRPRCNSDNENSCQQKDIVLEELSDLKSRFDDIYKIIFEHARKNDDHQLCTFAKMLDAANKKQKSFCERIINSKLTKNNVENGTTYADVAKSKNGTPPRKTNLTPAWNGGGGGE